MAEIDYTEPTTLRKAFKGVDNLFLNTPYEPNMVELTFSMIAEAKSGSIKHIIKLSYVNIPEEAARKGLKGVGIDDWFINSMMELYAIVSAGYASNLSSAVEELTGKKPIPFLQFARDYADSFK
jgi:hypothetical protein